MNDDKHASDIDDNRTRFLRTRPDNDGPKGHAWRLRVEWDPHTNGLTEIAEEKLTSSGPNAQVYAGGHVLDLTEDQTVWLHTTLGELVAHRDSKPPKFLCGMFILPADADVSVLLDAMPAVVAGEGKRCTNPARRHMQHHPSLGCCDDCYSRALIMLARYAPEVMARGSAAVVQLAELRYPLVEGGK